MNVKHFWRAEGWRPFFLEKLSLLFESMHCYFEFAIIYKFIVEAFNLLAIVKFKLLAERIS